MPLDANPLDVGSLPAVLAGPVLRIVTRTHASVWLALSRADHVVLHVQVAAQPGTEVASAPATPVQLGSHLWLVTVTVTAPGGQFAAGQLYEYRLTSAGWPVEPTWDNLAIGTTLPAFPGPPATAQDLKVLHTSCRKPHGGGRDGLSLAADVITERVAANTANPRPHLLVMSGDQIYADEVPTPLAPRVRRIAADLVGIDESATFGALPKIGGRQVPTASFGFTSSTASDHLWGLGEFFAAYLLHWSDALWPAALPAWADADPVADLDPAAKLDEESWNDLLAAIGLFRAGIPNVRKVLATVPSIMILDDHEVTDDWNISYTWAEAVYGNAAGSRIVTNGVLAYALFQHWGNRPDRFATPGTPEASLLTAATFTGASPDTPALRGLLGVPTAPPPGPPSVLRDLSAPKYDPLRRPPRRVRRLARPRDRP